MLQTEPNIKRNRLLAEKVIKGLESRQMKGYYADTKEEALKLALGLIPEGSTVAHGGSMTMIQTGLFEALAKGNYNFLDRTGAATPEALRQYMAQAVMADFFLCSANAMTEDGLIINIDGNSNRIAPLAYGPDKVLLIVSMNKVCKDLDTALSRARNAASPANAIRLNCDTPCTKTGTCMNCKSPASICCNFMVTRFSRVPGRILVILCSEDLGL